MNIVHHQDCLEAMRGMPDKAFDLAICDPPYGDGCDISDANSSRHRANGFSQQWRTNTHNIWNVAPSGQYFTELARVSVNQIIWGGNYFTQFLPPSSGWIVWDKCNQGFSFADGEIAWSSFSRALRIYRYTRGYTGRIHPTQKPAALYKWLLQNYAKPGDKILDTHLGSGSSRIAAYDLGFDFTGYETDPDYFQAQQERFERHIAQGSLFAPPVELVTQEALF